MPDMFTYTGTPPIVASGTLQPVFPVITPSASGGWSRPNVSMPGMDLFSLKKVPDYTNPYQPDTPPPGFHEGSNAQSMGLLAGTPVQSYLQQGGLILLAVILVGLGTWSLIK